MIDGTNELWVKICGVTTVEDARMIVEAGADAIGLNFASVSPRCIDVERAREIVHGIGPRVTWVGVFVDAGEAEMVRIYRAVGLDLAQFHGHETAEELRSFERAVGWENVAYKALRVGAPEDVATAQSYPGPFVLTDAKVKGVVGGTGQTFDWSLVDGLVKERRVLLAGGLHADNVARAVREVQPFGVDTASGVESAPGKKDPELVRAFVERAKGASRRGG